jgi:poly(A) polymerase
MRRSGLLQALFPEFCAWLERETDGFPHVRLGLALDWIDRRIGEGGKVSPQLTLSLIFGEYLEERGELLRRGGHTFQQSMDMAVAGFLGELSGIVLVPNRIGIQLRDILLSQSRFRKVPGKKPLSFMARHTFNDAFDYFCFVSAATGDDLGIRRWWESFIADNPRDGAEKPPAGQALEPAAPRPKRSRRRRVRKRPAQPQTP